MLPFLAWTSDHHEVPLPDGHPFPMGKYRAVREALVADGTVAIEHLHASESAPLAWLHAAHEPRWVARVINGELSAAEVRRIGLPWSEALVARARAAVFGTVMAGRAAVEHGVAANLAGGTHHAFHDRGEGYCLFNDHAVAIADLRARGHARRPFVLDLDVHQGNGTAAMYARDPSVFTLSLHGRTNYPAQKERSSLDIELEDGIGDDAYLEQLDRHVPDALDAHAPDVVFYQSGVDPLHTDRFGRLRLTHEGLAERDARVFAWCETRALAVVVTMGGGYGRPLETTVEAHANVFRAARRSLERRAARAAAERAR